MNGLYFKAFILLQLFIPYSLKAQISVTADSSTIGKYNVYELTINHAANYPNNWDDVTIDATFTGAETIAVNGFYYFSHVWKVRFAPPDIGSWKYIINFKTPDSVYSDTGSFTCIPSSTKGFLRRHPNNPFRLIYPDGTLFNGTGFEDCVLDFNGNGTPLDDFGFDGGFYPQNTLGKRIALTPYMAAYGYMGAAFNLFRWTTNNCSFSLYDTISTTGNSYSVQNGMFGDTLVRSLRANQIRIWLTLFGPPVFSNIDGNEPLEDAAIERYINYVVARYGAYVDIWELFNESSASSYYYTTISNYIRSIDPYHRLISVSDERPALACIDIDSPHWYQKESEFDSDLDAYNMITSGKTYNKPVIFGEQGNSVQNWDTLSSVRMRLRSWTAFFSEAILIFWNTSFAKNFYAPIAANIYIGPTERGYIRALQNFTAAADTTIIPFSIKPQNPGDVRAYGLSGDSTLFGYFHHYSSHSTNVTTSFSTRLKRSGTVYWINPANDSLIRSVRLPFGDQTIISPGFMIDLAMRIDLDSVNSLFSINQKLDIIIYPNPSAGEIAFDGNFNGNANVAIYTLSGRQVLAWNNVADDQN